MIYVELLGIALVPGFVSGIVYWCQKKGLLDRFNNVISQIIIGIIFGLIACMGTQFGIDINGAVANTRDAAIVSCGFIFGGTSGIIAGIIGGLYRWFSVYWGVGYFTRIGCTIACFLAGIMAALIKKYMFDNRIPSYIAGFFIGAVYEVVHMSLLFFTNANDLHGILSVVRTLTLPMVICNSIGVCLSIVIIEVLSGTFKKRIIDRNKKNTSKISHTFQKWLFGTVFCALILSIVFITVLQHMIATYDSDTILKQTLNDLTADVEYISDDRLLTIARDIKSELDDDYDLSYENMVSFLDFYGINEINVADSNGIIIATSNPQYMGYDMSLGEQSAEFLVLNDSASEYVQKYMPTSYDSLNCMKYAGISLKNGGFVQIGYDSDNFYNALQNIIIALAVNKHINNTGYIIILDDNYQIKSCGKDSHLEDYYGTDFSEEFRLLFEGVDEFTIVNGSIGGEDVFCMYNSDEGYHMVVVYPQKEIFFTSYVADYAYVFSSVVIFAILFALIYLLIKTIVVNNIYRINKTLSMITSGNLDVEVDVKSHAEFVELSNDINSTVTTLKQYIADAASRIDQELQYAQSIQKAALPHIEPNFVNKKEFDLSANMYTAKEIGGDFYDFYYVDDDHLVITIADVSGKGIPASLFMMTSKTMLKNMVESGLQINEAFNAANKRLCEGNDACMFVTVWSGMIDLRTGHVVYANAGHNPPAIKHSGNSFEFINGKVSMVLAAIDSVSYTLQEFDLVPGDVLYLYTDGVTEATNSEKQLYGDDRLLNILNETYSDGTLMEDICTNVKNDIDVFVDVAPQFDDITMVAFRYKG